MQKRSLNQAQQLNAEGSNSNVGWADNGSYSSFCEALHNVLVYLDQFGNPSTPVFDPGHIVCPARERQQQHASEFGQWGPRATHRCTPREITDFLEGQGLNIAHRGQQHRLPQAWESSLHEKSGHHGRRNTTPSNPISSSSSTNSSEPQQQLGTPQNVKRHMVDNTSFLLKAKAQYGNTHRGLLFYQHCGSTHQRLDIDPMGRIEGTPL